MTAPKLAIASAACLLLCGGQRVSSSLNPGSADAAALIGRSGGRYVDANWPAGSLVALNTAGSTPYYAPRHRFIDMLGLNDSRIARRKVDRIELPLQRLPGHLKGDGSYVLSRRPNFIILGPAEGTHAAEPWFLSDLEIGRDVRFARGYEPKHIRLDGRGTPVSHGGFAFVYYQRRGGMRDAEAASGERE
jgi:hypothetical protein